MTDTTTDPGYRLEYIVTAEAWYAPALANLDGFRDPSISVIKRMINDGAAWEFQILDHSRTIGRPAVRVDVFDDAFAAYGEIGPFFAALAAERPSTIDQVRVILDRMGFVDATERVDPDRVAPPQPVGIDGTVWP